MKKKIILVLLGMSILYSSTAFSKTPELTHPPVQNSYSGITKKPSSGGSEVIDSINQDLIDFFEKNGHDLSSRHFSTTTALGIFSKTTVWDDAKRCSSEAGFSWDGTLHNTTWTQVRKKYKTKKNGQYLCFRVHYVGLIDNKTQEIVGAFIIAYPVRDNVAYYEKSVVYLPEISISKIAKEMTLLLE